MKSTDYERFSSSANVDHKIRHWARVSLNSAYSRTIRNGTGNETGTLTAYENVWYTAQFMPAIYPMYMKDLDGNDVLDANGNRQLDYGDENESGRTRPAGGGAGYNSLGILLDNINRRTDDVVRYGGSFTLGSDEASAGVLQGLKLTVNLNGDVTNRRTTDYDNMNHGAAASLGGRLYKQSQRYGSTTFNQLLTYIRTFDRHSVNLLGGHEYYNYELEFLEGHKENLYPGIVELRPATSLKGADSYKSVDRIEAWFSRLNYGFDNKYYFEASLRRDGSSRFHKDYRWGTFWGVGASWRVSQENFMKNVSWIDNLTAKVSYGEQGNNNLDSYYAWDSLYSLSYPNESAFGVHASTLATPTISWETIGNLNTGIEATLFKGRVRFSLEYYVRNTIDMLLEYPTPISTGFENYNANMGNMVNKGIEFTLGATIVNRPNFSWDATLLGYTNRNKVTKLTDVQDKIESSTTIIEVGKPLRTFYMARFAGVDPETGAQLYWVYDKDENGNITNETTSTDKAKALTSKYYQGSRQPDFQGSFRSDFVLFKNIDLSFLTSFSLGGKVYDSAYASSMSPSNVSDRFHKDITKAWRKPGDVTNVPRAEFGASYTPTDRWLVNASYLMINNISLGYTLPSVVAKKLDLGSVRVYLSMDNVAMFNHMNGMDPSYNFSGGTNYTYSPSKITSIGLDINF